MSTNNVVYVCKLLSSKARVKKLESCAYKYFFLKFAYAMHTLYCNCTFKTLGYTLHTCIFAEYNQQAAAIWIYYIRSRICINCKWLRSNLPIIENNSMVIIILFFRQKCYSTNKCPYIFLASLVSASCWGLCLFIDKILPQRSLSSYLTSIVHMFAIVHTQEI